MSVPASSAFSSSTTNFGTLKELYSDDAWVMRTLILDNNPALAIIEKDETPLGIGGKYFTVPVLAAGGGGRSANFGLAQTSQSAPLTPEFQVTKVNNYSLFTITGEFLRASAESIGAFMPGMDTNVKAAFAVLGNDLAHDLFGDGSGTRGTYGLGAGSITSGVITLDNAQTAMFFQPGMILASWSVSGLTPTQSTGAALGYVIAVDTSAGTVTVSATAGGAAGTPSSWSTSFPYLGVNGDTNFISNGLSSSNMLKMAGFSSWVPAVSPGGSDSFFNVNRSVLPSTLAGYRFNGTGESIQDALIDSVNQLNAQATPAGTPDFIFINPVSYQALVKQLTSQGVYQMVKAKINEEVSISFKSLVLPTGTGEINILQDRNCPPQTAFIITSKTWKLRSLGKLTQFLTWPGAYDQIGIPVPSQDAVQCQLVSYNNLTCNAPAANAIVSLAQ